MINKLSNFFGRQRGLIYPPYRAIEKCGQYFIGKQFQTPDIWSFNGQVGETVPFIYTVRLYRVMDEKNFQGKIYHTLVLYGSLNLKKVHPSFAIDKISEQLWGIAQTYFHPRLTLVCKLDATSEEKWDMILKSINKTNETI
jgi:hypothetical protein